MATTKIWVVRDDISRVVGYAANPEKTSFESLKQVLAYAGDEDKTVHPIDKNERALLVNGVNCNAETAAEEMEAVQKRFDKTTGIVAYHAYQSFKTGEVTPELAHEIGVRLAKKMWGDQVQILVATHLNTGTYHNHFVVNAVGMWNGKKLRCNKGTYFRFRKLSDELSREYGLTVIENPKGYTPRNLYFAEKRGEPTKHNLMREALDEALEMSITPSVLIEVMRRKGYVLAIDPRHKHAAIRLRSEDKATRTFRLGEVYTKENLLARLRENSLYRTYECRELLEEFMSPKRLLGDFQPKQYRVRGSLKATRKVTGLFALYLRYCYRLGYYPKKNQRRPLSPELREAWRRIDRITAQTTLIGREKLHSPEDVQAFIQRMDAELEAMAYARNKLRNKLRNCTDEALIAEYKQKRNDCTAVLTQLRKDHKMALNILEDIPKMKDDLRREKDLRREALGLNDPKNKQRKKEYER